ncbi:hypothetical protein MtrunA17_Chr7g0215881 [Medicago truncatula]|uniref:Transmembrane protein n=1 Tax=Medicago truncatula TaxID=3880 RepID=A0A396GSV7_MEDTR|nr:hypothetical protein MtrunA17_Chr7g0215881 [Medicago truncatula]
MFSLDRVWFSECSTIPRCLSFTSGVEGQIHRHCRQFFYVSGLFCFRGYTNVWLGVIMFLFFAFDQRFWQFSYLRPFYVAPLLNLKGYV